VRTSTAGYSITKSVFGGTKDRLPFGDGKFDLVTCFNVSSNALHEAPRHVYRQKPVIGLALIVRVFPITQESP
jgi:hypothetical protein